ncbi:cell wall-binding repeat-containing protein [Jeotgalibacillus proteolyticus]|uniref:cell wall-binding repeat-containing protein n=1 Tax=Jeotgalibacillus proteolyticus TaxID=2082395 RepID=UPI003CEF3892
MNRKLVSGFLSGFLILSLFFSQLSLMEVNAEVMVPNEEETLTLGEPVEAGFEEGEIVHWYTIDPSEMDIEEFTHFRVKLQSEQELNITVYSSIENAVDNRAFDRYMNYSYMDEPAIIDFPIAWTGPYYIKVESYGTEYYEDENGELIEISGGPYTIGYDGITLAPSDDIIGEECTVELAVDQREEGKGILSDLRTIREEVLSQTDKGKDLSAVYYKAAPFISTKMVLSKTVRDDVFNNLVQLKPLFKDIAANGSASTYKITKEDQASINGLYSTALDSVPEFLKEEIQKAGTGIGVSNLTNQTVSSILSKGGYSTAKPDDNRLIVKLKDGKKISSIQSKTKSYGVQSIEPLAADESVFPNMFVLEVEASSSFQASAQSMKSTAAKLDKLPEVDFVEPVQQYQAFTADALYAYQWSLENDGAVQGVADADINYTELRDLLEGKELTNTVIAVLDTGVDHTLADLSDSVQTESGYNFVGRNRDAMDDYGHGTHVAGIIAAATDNHYSMAGINPYADIMPVKVLDASGGGDTEQIAYGIKYAVDQGAQVLNMSLGGPYSRVIEYALKYANDRNVTIVAASGNEAYEEVSYPASSKYAIAVGSTNRMDIVADYSNYGEGLDLVAPGSEVPSLMPDGNVVYQSGTSMATPHVAAVAGLLLSHNPELLPGDIESILTRSAQDIAFEESDNPYQPFDPEDPYYSSEPVAGYDLVSGWGRLDAYNAINFADEYDGEDELFERISGKDRYETSVKVSAEGWKSSEHVIIAAGGDYPDALSATPLAYKHQAPLLLTKAKSLPDSVKDEIVRLNARSATIVGGGYVVSPNVEKELKSLGIKNVKRISGKDRYETSVNVAKELGLTELAVVVNGNSYADALSIAPIASWIGMPILLTKSDSIPPALQEYKKTIENQTFIIGGKSIVSDKVAKSFPSAKRLSGANRYETNSEIINYFHNLDSVNMSTVFIATGQNFPDALAGSAFAGINGNPIILTNPMSPKQTTIDTVSGYAHETGKYYVIGGESVLPASTFEALFE